MAASVVRLRCWIACAERMPPPACTQGWACRPMHLLPCVTTSVPMTRATGAPPMQWRCCCRLARQVRRWHVLGWVCMPWYPASSSWCTARAAVSVAPTPPSLLRCTPGVGGDCDEGQRLLWQFIAERSSWSHQLKQALRCACWQGQGHRVAGRQGGGGAGWRGGRVARGQTAWGAYQDPCNGCSALLPACHRGVLAAAPTPLSSTSNLVLRCCWQACGPGPPLARPGGVPGAGRAGLRAGGRQPGLDVGAGPGLGGRRCLGRGGHHVGEVRAGGGGGSCGC